MSKLAYNVPEAADMLGISPEQVRRLVRAGDLKAVRSAKLEEKPSGAKRGGKLLITEASMKSWLASLEVA
jgi:excisionase family DNA binding protein